MHWHMENTWRKVGTPYKLAYILQIGSQLPVFISYPLPLSPSSRKGPFLILSCLLVLSTVPLGTK